MNARTIGVLALVMGIVAPPATADITIKTKKDGMKVIWTLTVDGDDAIHSLHIKGPNAGNLGFDPIITPPGWDTATGFGQLGKYGWERQDGKDAAGTWEFGLTLQDLAGLESAKSVGVDYAVNPTKIVPLKAPASPDMSNWAFVPVPSPGSFALLSVGGLLAVRRRRLG